MARGGRGSYSSYKSSYYAPRTSSYSSSSTYLPKQRAPPDPPGALHKIENAKSERSKCHADKPCQGTSIASGALRYGAKHNSEQYGETWLCRHWGCVTPEILRELKATGVSKIVGYSSLASSDKERVKAAIKAGHVAPADVPDSAKPLDWSQMQATLAAQAEMNRTRAAQLASTQTHSHTFEGVSSSTAGAGPSSQRSAVPAAAGQKRKADVFSAGPSSSSQPSSSQTTARTVSFSASQPAASQATIVIEDSDDEFDVPPIEIVPKDDHYIDFRTVIVGIQYYTGLVNRGEEVNVQRQPQNPHDRNAICVMNMGNTMVGHLKREVVAKLAPLIDSDLVAVEGVMDGGNMNGVLSYTLPITLKIYGSQGIRDQLEPLLKWATPGQRGFTPAMRAGTGAGYVAPPAPSQTASQASGSVSRATNGGYSASSSQQTAQQATARAKLEADRQAKLAAERVALQKAEDLRKIIKSFETVDDDTRRGSLLDSLCSTDDILNLPLQENPPSVASGDLGTNLMKHQLQALKWMLAMENPVLPTSTEQPAVQFWKYVEREKAYYENIVSHQPLPLTTPPVLGRGGLMADAMGLGKTLSMISLIVATRKNNSKEFSGSTLIVAPVSVLRTWEAQVTEHCAPGLLRVYTYHEKGRDIVASQLQKYDVVITSYGAVNAEYTPESGDGPAASSQKKTKKKGRNVLFGIKWKRIILDEGHTIRNPTTKIHKSLCALEAERRWVVTGTPIINSPKDLGAILHFLRICTPLDNQEFYNRVLIRPLARADPNAATLLKALMSHMCLRRTKEMQDSTGKYLVDLPPVEMTTIRVTLDPETRRLYDEIAGLSQERFMRQVNGVANVSEVRMPHNALSMLTRLRQLTLHPGLVPRNYLDELRASVTNDEPDPHAQKIVITPAERTRLQHKLFQMTEDSEECPVCFDTLRDPVITSCTHAFCRDCILMVLQKDPKCPMDRREITAGDLIEPLPPIDATQAQIRVEDADDEDVDDSGIRSGSSAKINQLIRLLELTPPDEKSIVFSQFTSFLDKIADQLTEAGIRFVRFDGSMSAARRRDVLERFNIPLDGSPSTQEPPRRKPNAKGSSDKLKGRSFDDLMANFDESPKDVVERPTKRPRPNFLPELSSDSDDDIGPATSKAQSKRSASSTSKLFPPLSSDDDDDEFPAPPPRKAKRAVAMMSSDDYDPSGEPHENDADDDEDVKLDVNASDDESDFAAVEPDSPPPKKKGKGKAKASARSTKDDKRAALLKSYDLGDGIPTVMLISLKAGALGLQLTAANNVYLMDPWWQEGIESQAIDRCNRIGQKRNVHVYQMIAEDTIESRVLDIQERKRTLIKHAFSGTKAKETQRSTKKEARLQDMIELFGIRRQAAEATSSQAASQSASGRAGQASSLLERLDQLI